MDLVPEGRRCISKLGTDLSALDLPTSNRIGSEQSILQQRSKASSRPLFAFTQSIFLSSWPIISLPSSAQNKTRLERSQTPENPGTDANTQVNCSFYYKIGACRHGDRCSRKHVKPSYSQTILLPNLYQNPAYDPKNKMNPSQLQNHFDAFYEDFWCEMCKYGEIEEVVVCDNNNDRTSSPLPHHTRTTQHLLNHNKKTKTQN